jgi:hypothetical protein
MGRGLAALVEVPGRDGDCHAATAPLNSGAQDAERAAGLPWTRVAARQTEVHRWPTADPGRRFDDLFNFARAPATLIMASDRVAGNAGSVRHEVAQVEWIHREEVG